MLQAHDSIATSDFTSVDLKDEVTSDQLVINLDKKPNEGDNGEIIATENYFTDKNKHVGIDDNDDEDKIITTPVITVDQESVSSSDDTDEIDDTDENNMTDHSDMNTVAVEDTTNDNADVPCWDLPSSKIKESAFQPPTTDDNTVDDKKHIREDVKEIPSASNDIKEEHVKENEIRVEDYRVEGGMPVEVPDNATRTIRMFRNAKESLVSIY